MEQWPTIYPTPPKVVAQYQPVRPDVNKADPDVVMLDTATLPPEIIGDLILQQIGGIELIAIVNHATVAGRAVSNRVVSNLGSINSEFNPSTLAQSKSNVRRSKYAINLSLYQVADSPIVLTGDGKYIVITLNDLPYGYTVEAQMEVSESTSAFAP